MDADDDGQWDARGKSAKEKFEGGGNGDREYSLYNIAVAFKRPPLKSWNLFVAIGLKASLFEKK